MDKIEIEKTWSNQLSEIIKPNHYKSQKFDVIDICNEYDMNFNRGNIIKYVVRAGKKDKSKEIEDLKKAQEYLQREIKYLEMKENE